MPVDVLELSRELIRLPSVTPTDAGCMAVLERVLGAHGFDCRRMRFGEVENLYARRGASGRNLCFAGHVDVVPVGDAAAWSRNPFGADVDGGLLHGRGAADMKPAIAAWIAAVADLQVDGSLSLLITGDEEGPAIDGTRKVVEQLQAEGERLDGCVVGEPSSAEILGDMIKVGRRGSLNAWITVEGVQGHVAYPHRAANPVPVLIDLLARLQGRVLDEGYPEFQPSNLEVTTVDVGNPAANVIPAEARARLNIRFNPAHRGADLAAWIEQEAAAIGAGFGGRIDVRPVISGEAFLTEPGPFTEVVAGAVQEVLGRTPELSTTGGTSDARFIRALCPVVELGLVGTTIHQVDERSPVADILALERVYRRVAERFFAVG
jgi:succinyl-diaminopimelate desuccinylase